MTDSTLDALRYNYRGKPFPNGFRRRAPKGMLLPWLDEHKNFTGSECLIWPFGRTRTGYGLVHRDGRKRQAHRLMCEHRHGPPPTPAHHAAHLCGKGHTGCVNPMHLAWKTPTENAADSIKHGVTPRGERCVNAKLTEADVLAIRSIIGISHAEIARQYGVSQTHVSRIKSRDIWAWLEEEQT